MKSLLPYFIEFYENNTIVSKEYLDDYIVRGPNYGLIIIIIYNESIFSTNNRRKKV